MIAHSRKLIFLLICMGFMLGCSENSSSSGNDSESVVLPDDDIFPSTWIGYFLSGEDDKYSEDEIREDFDFDDDDIFVVGVIAEDDNEDSEVVFIGDADQYVGSGGSLTIDELLPVRSLFYGDLYHYTWNTQGLDNYLADVETITMSGNIFFLVLFEGLYGYTDTEEYWEYQLTRYTTSGISPDIKRIAGTWTIQDSFKKNNTLTFVIDPEDSSSATVQGTDSLSNDFDGTIEIHYTIDDANDDYATYVYDLNLTLNGSETLDGLVTYISSMDSEGITVTDALAIGAWNEDFFVTGIAEKED